ncbi:hypothetical protein SAY86_013026 [Trapa natans]|uniref:RING-type domain-containing protein n=1 Tax=Trapa natans TaxID=22666 RepID=A0AAN7R9R0_TRANT|nr:hypothetical protein SAY86_013026 [Trapa natans]
MSIVEAAASSHIRDFFRFKDDDAASSVDSRRSDVDGLIFDVPGSSERLPSSLHSSAVSAPPPVSRTLLDIILSEGPNIDQHKRPAQQGHHGGKDKKSWKSFKDRLRLKRAGPGLNPASQATPSDFLSSKTRPSPLNMVGPVLTEGPSSSEDSLSMEDKPRKCNSYVCEGSTSRASTRFGTLVPISIEPDRSSGSSEHSSRPQLSCHNSTRYTSRLTESPGALTRSESSPISRGRSIPQLREVNGATSAEEPPQESARRLSLVLAEEREQSAREAAGSEQPVRMSLMDLLEKTDRQMGLEGTRYILRDDEEGGEAAAAVAREEESGCGRGVEQNCCICMVRHKGAAFIPCGHTFCRLCSRELWVSRGSCPLCNSHIAEILDLY